MHNLPDILRARRARVQRLVERRRDQLRARGALFRPDPRLAALYTQSERLLCELADASPGARRIRRVTYRRRSR